MASKKFEQAVERATCEKISELRDTPIDVRRVRIEDLRGRLLNFVSLFPFIGRGNVLGSRALSHEKAEKAFLEATR